MTDDTAFLTDLNGHKHVVFGDSIYDKNFLFPMYDKSTYFFMPYNWDSENKLETDL